MTVNRLQLTPHFNLSEFVRPEHHQLSDYQIAMLKILASNLETVRGEIQIYREDPDSEVQMIVTSGVRTREDLDRLKSKGYNPSRTSDHLCGLSDGGKPTLGAADTVYKNCSLSVHDTAALIIDLDRGGFCSFGQIIYERNARGSEWIHLSNDPRAIFTSEVASAVHRTRYLMSVDNGSKYLPFE